MERDAGLALTNAVRRRGIVDRRVGVELGRPQPVRGRHRAPRLFDPKPVAGLDFPCRAERRHLIETKVRRRKVGEIAEPLSRLAMLIDVAHRVESAAGLRLFAGEERSDHRRREEDGAVRHAGISRYSLSSRWWPARRVPTRST